MSTNNKISLEQSLKAYQVMHAPAKFSWKQHWAQETFSSPDMLSCTPEEQEQFKKRLKECNITLCTGIKSHSGDVVTLDVVVSTITNPVNKNIPKTQRKAIFSTSNGARPTGDTAYDIWNGFQVIDMDIKDAAMAKKLKHHLFKSLHKCNWFMGITYSASGMGLHIYTKIAIPETIDVPVMQGYSGQTITDTQKKRMLYLTNFRHKFSFVYIACLAAADELGYKKEDLLKWLDKAMNKPQQGAFLGYDPHPFINTGFFEDFIYIDFDNASEIGAADVDWISHPDLRNIFKGQEWMELNNDNGLNITATADDLIVNAHTKVHYKHNERWRLANTLVALYDKVQGYNYLRMICSNDIKNRELQSDCETAKRHNKTIDPWAVNRLNSVHGFNIKMSIDDQNFDESEIFTAMDRIENPTIIYEAKTIKTFNIKANEYLGHISNELLNSLGRITLIEAGAGVGKTEMVKSLVRAGKRILMIMPFTSTIKAKVEQDPNWYYCYGNKRVRLDRNENGLCMTIDKFAGLEQIGGCSAIKAAGYDYIFIDESHLLFQSEYRPVMPKVIDMVRNTEVPIILMSGTPSGELTFFSNAVHLRVIKEDLRKKVFTVNLTDKPNDQLYHMCRQMANDIANGRHILFPCNRGTLFSKQVKAAVTYFLQYEHAIYDEVNLQYYKKSNVGDEFMDDINIEKTIKDVQILMCTTYLSVGVDILDKYNFSIYFEDLMMPQEVEQFANRLRANDLFINMYVAKNDSEGNTRSLHKYKEVNFEIDDEEKKFVLSVIQLCNAMIERNNKEYKSNAIVYAMLKDCTFIEHNPIDDMYYLNLTAYRTVCFERKYREYVQQLPVLMKGMQSYGYEVTSIDRKAFECEGMEDFANLKDFVKLAYNDQLQLNTTHIEELMDEIKESNLSTYKQVLHGIFDIKKGSEWSIDLTKERITVKNIEIFEKVVPIFVSLSKRYNCEQITEIFEYCRNENKTFNFAAIGRIRTLVNLLYNDRNNRLDMPIKDFMEATYKFSELGVAKKSEIIDFCNNQAELYARQESRGELNINYSLLMMDKLKDKFYKLFRCLVNVGKPKKKDGNKCSMERVELLWKERTDDTTGINERIFELSNILGIDTINQTTIDDVMNNSDDTI
jgi:hypothetical protein